MLKTGTLEESGIFRQIEDKEDIIKEVIDRSVEYELQQSSLDAVLSDTAYSEIKRLEKNSKSEELAHWRSIYRSLLTDQEKEKRSQLHEITARYTRDVIGNFNPKVYKFATSLLPMFFSFFFRTVTPKSVIFPSPEETDIDKIVILKGQIELIQKLSKKGTIILVPTHLSNMDSIVIGWALYRIGLPPFTYGAGKNLFTNPILSYFMHNLGAYRVDRRLRHRLYKDVLKIYSTVILERNYHSLFFPGGTRSRSGAVESKLKLGLLGTGIKAYINNLLKNSDKPNIYVVPCTINYHLVLEAETLIDDYLEETGKARYIIERDESSSFAKVFNFIFQSARMDTSLYIKFGNAYDLFGNRVNEEGKSFDNHGRLIDPRKYVMKNGQIIQDEQRDTEYTIELGERIVEDYYRNNIILPTHLIAFCIFQAIKKLNPKMDLYRLVKLTPDEAIISSERIYNLIDKVKQEIISLNEQNKISVEDRLVKQSSEQILNEAVKTFNTYYKKELITEKFGNIIVYNLRLMFYYQNRLIGYNLEKLV